MNTRNASYKDAPAIKLLLEELGCKTTISILIDQLEEFTNHQDYEVIVCEQHNDVLGFAAIHYVSWLGIKRENAIVTCLYSGKDTSVNGIMKVLEDQVTRLAFSRKCSAIQVRTNDSAYIEFEFYQQAGYQPSPAFYTKNLNY